MAAVRRIIVQRIPFTVELREVRDYFSQFGAIEKCFLQLNKRTGFYTGEGWVKFVKKEAMTSVLEKNDHKLDGYKIQVKGYEQKIHGYTAEDE